MKQRNDINAYVREVENVFIPMSDGCRLAARIWMPHDALESPVPAVLEYIPYRKRDMRTYEDSINQPYLAAHGYAGVRVDIRGSGDSEGVLEDEYHPQELQDGLEIIDWIAAQPWCNGRLGMVGISWGGFNGLQIAALQPPQLQAIITICSTDDRYADDVHYMGGCLLNDNVSWASIMFAHNSTPPDPHVVGEDWRKLWFDRLQGSGLWVDKWTRRQRRNEYWKHGSVCEDFSKIKCPVYAASGWADGYSNSVFRLMEHLHVPRKGLVGPWKHRYPHLGEPAPAIGFLQESLRWWDYWLKDYDSGIMDEPMLHLYLQESVRPKRFHAYRPGRWIAEHSWPATSTQTTSFFLSHQNELVKKKEIGETAFSVDSPLRTGLSAGKWCSYGGPDLPGEQRESDELSLTFDTDGLAETIEVVGAPTLSLSFSSNQPNAQIAVRLCDVHESGESTLITYGVLNLTHFKSHEHPQLLEPDKVYQTKVQLNDIAQQIPAGHKLRLSISNTYWPVIWPSPEQTELKIYNNDTHLTLPLRASHGADTEKTVFAEAEGSPKEETSEVEPGEVNRWITQDLNEANYSLQIADSDGRFRIHEIETTVEKKGYEEYNIREEEPLSAEAYAHWSMGFVRTDWNVRSLTETTFYSSKDKFHIKANVKAYQDGKEIFKETWNEEIERDHV